MLISFFYTICLFAFITWFFRRYVRKEDSLFFIGGYLLKISFGLLFGYFYSSYLSGGDTLRYFQASNEWSSLFFEDVSLYFNKIIFTNESYSGVFPGQPRAIFFSKFLSIFSIISNQNYWLMTLCFSTLSFFSSWYFFRRLLTFQEKYRLVFWLSLFVFPGTQFWGSGVIKETIIISSLFILSGVFIDFLISKKWPNWIMILLSILSIFLIIKLKYYVIAVFFPLYIIAWYWEILNSNYIAFFNRKWKKYTLSIFVLILLTLFVSRLSPNFTKEEFLGRVFLDHKRILKRSDPSFTIQYDDFKPEVVSFLKNTPLAAFSGLYRPLIGEGNSILHLLIGLQNLLLLALTLAAFINVIRKQLLVPPPWILLTLLYCIVIAIFFALAIPNFGTLERFKAMYQPFLIILLGCATKSLIDSLNLFRPSFKSEN